ncbi:MAG: ABC transporter permease [Rubrimonas sp.]
MTPHLRLALAHCRAHWGRTLALAAAIALIAFVPLAARLALSAAERQLTARAEATPLVVGARGAALDLVLNGLYFTDARPPMTRMAAAEAIWASGLADAYPLHVRFRVGQNPVVGATLDYFDFRGLRLAQGRGLAILGEAVLGAGAAQALAAGPGDAITTAPESLFDLGGVYPLRLRVVGVLAPTGGPDDAAVFVDIATAWVIAGVGHGHDPVAADPAGAVEAFVEITEDNIDSFHFHGDPAGFPVSLVIAAPRDARSAAILRGRYLDPASADQIFAPADSVAALLDRVFRVGRVLDAASAAMAAAAALAIAVAMRLAIRLRAPEFAALERMGAPRSTVLKLILAENVIVLSLAVIVLGVLFIPAARMADTLAFALVAQ